MTLKCSTPTVRMPFRDVDSVTVLTRTALVTAQIAMEIEVSSREIEKLYGYLDENMLKLE